MKAHSDIIEKTFALMKAKRLTFREARAELGRRSGLVRSRERRRRESQRAQPVALDWRTGTRNCGLD